MQFFTRNMLDSPQSSPFIIKYLGLTDARDIARIGRVVRVVDYYYSDR